MAEELSRSIRELIYAQEFGLIDDPVGQAIQRNFRAGVADSFVHDLLHGRVYKHKIQQAFTGPFPRPKLKHGDFTPGLDVHGERIFIPHHFLNEHFLVTGSSGCGKTTLARLWTIQMALLACVGIWWFDYRKREGRAIQPVLARAGVDCSVVDARQLRINPLQVPLYCDPRDYASNVSDMLVRVLKLPPGAQNLLHQAIFHLYRQFGVLDGGRNYPTLFDLEKTIAANRHANRQAQSAALLRLQSVLLSIGKVLSYHVGWTSHDLAKFCLIFELGSVGETDKDLISNTLLLSEFSSRISQGMSNATLNLWIVTDEAGRIAGSNDSCLADLVTIARGCGIGLLLSVQSAKDIAPQVLSNTPNRIVGRCAGWSDLEAVGSAMGLTIEQKRWLSTHLRPGLFLGQLGQEWRHPFLFRVPAWPAGRVKDAPDADEPQTINSTFIEDMSGKRQ